MPRKVRVRCSFTVEVEVPDDPDYNAYFDLVENHCPATGRVGQAFEEAYAANRKTSTCWACALDGECRII